MLAALLASRSRRRDLRLNLFDCMPRSAVRGRLQSHLHHQRRVVEKLERMAEGESILHAIVRHLAVDDGAVPRLDQQERYVHRQRNWHRQLLIARDQGLQVLELPDISKGTSGRARGREKGREGGRRRVNSKERQSDLSGELALIQQLLLDRLLQFLLLLLQVQ